jgi:hypothetical protein
VSDNALQDLINQMPGGTDYIDSRWRQERVDVRVEVANDTTYDKEGYTFARALLNAVLAEYGPVNDDEAIIVPPFIADLLAWWSDSDLYGFWVERV